MSIQIWVRDTETQQQTTISMKDPKDSHKPLGTHQNPARVSTQRCQVLSQEEKKMIVFSRLDIVLPQLYIPQPLWENDSNIMGEIMMIEHEKSPSKLQQINKCRLYLQVTWLSKMTNPQGTLILPEFLEFTRAHTDVSRSNLKWPIQALPPKTSCEVWKRLI
jgi:hypothetical protein